ncbi:NAD(+) diphosphatase [Aliikangiella maris]|uniref:NAD(+) diphosphatase n=2 Tax=Aliikangiella maris TaxID=3162458 RepID=A0ABV3MIM2_9GAMM
MIQVIPINRQAELRTDRSFIEQQRAHPASRHILWYEGQVLFGEIGHYFSSRLIKKYQPLLSNQIYLGEYQQIPYFAHQIIQNNSSFDTFEFKALRAAGLLVDNLDLGLLFYTQGLFNWHNSHQFCGWCGQQSQIIKAGHSRRCVNKKCQKEHFPRIEPAVIFSVENNQSGESQILLARQPVWDEHRYSVLAGFVEHGESLEQAVKRECQEEVGLNIDSVEYISSQPWPFPGSLMLGFACQTTQTEIYLNDNEIEIAEWFNIERFEKSMQQGLLKMPFSVSISRFLIDRWYHKNTGKSLNAFQTQLR